MRIWRSNFPPRNVEQSFSPWHNARFLWLVGELMLEFRQDRVLKDGKVMIVAQNKLIRELLPPALKQAGAGALLFGNGVEMLREFKQFQPDIIFAEYAMDLINGVQFFQQLRREHKATTPVVLMGDRSDTELTNKARDAGISETLMIPFSVGDLIKVSKKLIDKRDAPTELRFGPRPPKTPPAGG